MDIAVNGATRLFVIVGDPIVQVRSPSGITEAFASHGLNAILVPVHVSPADLSGFVEAAAKVRNLDGILVTIPHKFACYRLCQSASERSHLLGVVNAMRRAPDGNWFGDMIDGPGFVGAIRAKGCDPKGLRALMTGAGGAGSAIAAALLDDGVRELAIHDPNIERRDALIDRLRPHFKTPVSVGSSDPSGFDLIANASPAGMKTGDTYPVDVARLNPAMFVGCVITVPAVPPLIEAARRLGCKTSTGNDMFDAEQQLLLDFLTNGVRLQ